MSYNMNKQLIIFRILSLIAILFGIATIKSGGMVLFTQGEAHQAAGNYVPFVLWFNFIAGFAYITTGIGLWLQRRWAVLLALVIAVLTLLVFIALGVHIYTGGAYEERTTGAMSMRLTIWASIALTANIMARHHPASAD